MNDVSNLGEAAYGTLCRNTLTLVNALHTVKTFSVLAALWTLATLTSFPAAVQAITPNQIVVVVNEGSAISERTGEYYRLARRIPEHHLIRIRTDSREEIDRKTFQRAIEQPIAAHLLRHRLQDQVLVIVLTKGVPLKIRGSGGFKGMQASVDSELALLYRALVQGPLPPEGRIANPYFHPEKPVPFNRVDYDTYLVTRLDGYTWEDIRGLIDRAARPATHGKVILEMKAAFPGSGSETGNAWLRKTAERLKGSGLEVLVNESPKPVTGETGVFGYAGWGSNDPRHRRQRSLGLHWLPGAIASWFVSTSARTFTSPPAGWTTGSWDDPKTFYAGSPQSLIGDLIAGGVTGVVGYVDEPYLDGTARPDILFPAYHAGFTLVESFYMALPYLSWQSVVIGDPLTAPFGPVAVSGPSPPPGIGVFLQRRAATLESVLKRAPSPQIRRALALAYAEQAGEKVREHQLDEALTLARKALGVKADEPGVLYALGVVYAARGERAEAEEAFRALIRTDPASPYAREAERRLRH